MQRTEVCRDLVADAKKSEKMDFKTCGQGRSCEAERYPMEGHSGREACSGDAAGEEKKRRRMTGSKNKNLLEE